MKRLFLFLSVFLAFTDQCLKFAVLKIVDNKYIVIIPNLVSLVFVQNEGAAFGIFQNKKWIFILFTILAIFCFIYIIFFKEVDNKLFIISSIFVVGGGIGNLIDRIFRGFVIDYIKLSFFPPVFNFADMCVSAGGAALVVYACLEKHEGKVLPNE